MLQETMSRLGGTVLILSDPDNMMVADEAARVMRQAEFQSDQLQLSGKQYWFYTPLINRSQQTQWTIRSNNILYAEMDFYLHCQGSSSNAIPLQTLGLNEFLFAASYSISVTLPYDTECGLLQRVKGAYNPARNYLVPPTVAEQQSMLNTVLTLLILGAVAALIVYNLLLFVSIRNSAYFFYTVYACFHLLLFLMVSFKPDFIVDYFKDPRQALHVLSASVMVFAILFTLKFMQPGIASAQCKPNKRFIVKLIAILKTLCWLALLLMLLFLLDFLFFPENFQYTLNIYPIIYLVCSLLIPLLSLTVAISGYKPAWIFFPAWSLLFASHIVAALDVLNIFALRGLAPSVIALAAAIEMILLSLALGMSLRASLLESHRAQLEQKSAGLLVEQQEKFISTLSHEIRTPLHALLGASNLLGKTPLSAQQQRYWETTSYAAESMYALVDNLLDRTEFKHAQALEKETVFDPQRLIETMVQLLHYRAEEKRLVMQLHTDGLPKHLEGKPIVLRRMLINLISNAIKYTDHGSITIRVSWCAEGQHLSVQVTDTGRGMSPLQLQHIKARFNVGVESLYSEHASSGLGLPICFEMIKAAGGHFELDSQIGHGTTAHFTLGMCLSPVVEPSTSRLSDRISDVSLKLLIVDDLASNRMIASELLMTAGHVVTEAKDGQHALSLLQKQVFDGVISDIRMPGMDGIALLTALRHRYPPATLAIIMTSAHFDQHQRQQLLAMGADVCLDKPYTPATLLSTLDVIASRSDNNTAVVSKPLTAKPSTDQSTIPIFEKIKSSLGSEKTTKVLFLYQQQLQEDVMNIAQAAQCQDEQSLRVAAHRIVSASRALGFSDNAEAALRVEQFEASQATVDWVAFNALITESLVIFRRFLAEPDKKIDGSC